MYFFRHIVAIMTFPKGRYKHYVQIRIVNILGHIKYTWSILKENAPNESF